MARFRAHLLLVLPVLLVPPTLFGQSPGQRAVSQVLDEFHAAAASPDFNRYFGLFSTGGVFLGTDASEHWTVDEFKTYARPVFDAGRGWTYVSKERHVYLSSDGNTAWFDELLDNASLGQTRGTGVLVLEDGAWKVAQYHLTIPVPNEVAGRVVDMIRDGGR